MNADETRQNGDPWLAYPVDESGNIIPGVKPLRLWLNPGHAPQDAVANFFCALSDLQKAHGGHGLRFVAENEQEPS